MRNSVPKVLNTLRPDLEDIAAWTGRSRALANVWRNGKFQPKAPERARLIDECDHASEARLVEWAMANGYPDFDTVLRYGR